MPTNRARYITLPVVPNDKPSPIPPVLHQSLSVNTQRLLLDRQRGRRELDRASLISSSHVFDRGMRQQFLEQLNKLRFVDGSDARHPSLNVNSHNLAVVRAVISSGLYPNVIYAR